MKSIFFILVILSLTSCGFNRPQNITHSRDNTTLEPEQSHKDIVVEDEVKPYIHDNSVLCDDHLVLCRTVEDYDIQVTRVPNSNVITKVHSTGECYQYADNTLYLTVHYKGKLLFKNKMFTKETFDNIDPEDLQSNQLMPSNYFNAKVTNDTLKIWLDMYRPESDIGYNIFINVSYNGDISYCTKEDDGGEGQEIEW